MASAIKNAGENGLMLLYTGPTSGTGIIKPSELLALIQPYYGNGKTIHFVNVNRKNGYSYIATSLVPVDVLVDEMTTTTSGVFIFMKNDTYTSNTSMLFRISGDYTSFTNIEGDLSIYVF